MPALADDACQCHTKGFNAIPASLLGV